MTIEVSAKKVQDAIDQGLKQLGASIDDVTVEVLDAGGFLRKAKVRLTLDAAESADSPVEQPAAAKPEKKAEEPAVEAMPEKKAEKPAAAKTEKSAAKTEKSAAEKPTGAGLKNARAGAGAPKKKSAPEKPQKQKSETAEKSEPADSAERQPAEKPKKRAAAPAAKLPREDGSAPSENPPADDGKSAQDKPRRERKKHWGEEEKAAAARALEFVKKTVELMGFTGVTVEHAADDAERINITAPEGDDSLIIGRHGETLSALTFLAETCAIAESCRVGVSVDCNGYRDRRAASLTSMARRRAHECAAKQRKIKLEPMDRTDRRTVHMALADDAYVTTESEGKEPYRCVVILPKEGVRPEASGRDRGERRDRRDRGGRDRRESRGTSAPQKRAAFNVNIHGFVGHNDPVPETEKADEAEKADDKE